jgi:hypothetical protein
VGIKGGGVPVQRVRHLWRTRRLPVVIGAAVVTLLIAGLVVTLVSKPGGGGVSLAQAREPAVPVPLLTDAPTASPSDTPSETPTPMPAFTEPPTVAVTAAPSRSPLPRPTTAAPTPAAPAVTHAPVAAAPAPQPGVATVVVVDQSDRAADVSLTDQAMPGHTTRIQPGQTLTMTVVPDPGGHDSWGVRDTVYTGCGGGEGGSKYFTAGLTYRLVITTIHNACEPGAAGTFVDSVKSVLYYPDGSPDM